MNLLWFIIIGLVAGWLAGLLMKGRGFGVIGDIIVGIIGAVIGGFVFGLFGLSPTNTWGSIVTALIGAIILLGIVKLVKHGDA